MTLLSTDREPEKRFRIKITDRELPAIEVDAFELDVAVKTIISLFGKSTIEIEIV